MTKTKSAKKAHLVSERKRKHNLAIKEKIKTAIKKIKKEEKKHKDLKEVFSLLDRAAVKKVIHKNTAARIKSRLVELIKKGETAEKPQKTKKSKK